MIRILRTTKQPLLRKMAKKKRQRMEMTKKRRRSWPSLSKKKTSIWFRRIPMFQRLTSSQACLSKTVSMITFV